MAPFLQRDYAGVFRPASSLGAQTVCYMAERGPTSLAGVKAALQARSGSAATAGAASGPFPATAARLSRNVVGENLRPFHGVSAKPIRPEIARTL